MKTKFELGKIFFSVFLSFFFYWSMAEASGFLINKKKSPAYFEESQESAVPQEEPMMRPERIPSPSKLFREETHLQQNSFSPENEVERLKKLVESKQREIVRLHAMLDEEKQKNEELRAEMVEKAPVEGKMYEVRKNDNLWKISKRKDVYNDAAFWIKIYNANMDRIKNPNVIFPGQLFRIPD